MSFIVPKFVTKDPAWNASKDIDQKSAHKDCPVCRPKKPIISDDKIRFSSHFTLDLFAAQSFDGFGTKMYAYPLPR